MKKFISKYVAWLVLIVMFCMLIPGIGLRMETENKNNNITISVLYSNFENKVGKAAFNNTLEKFKKIGVNTVSVMEDDLNYLVSKGEITCIKYNVLGHKYDLESIELQNKIKEVYPEIAYDSYVLIIDEDNVKEKFKKLMPKRFSEKEYVDIGSFNNLDIYVLKDGRKALWDYAIGYDEDVIKLLKAKGFEIALVHKVKNYPKTDYLKDIERIVKEYDVKYMNLKEDSYTYDEKEQNKNNYKILTDIITDNDMTLVVTENVDQLSNQKVFGYSHIFDKVSEKTGKIMRSYETYDQSQEDESKYKYRIEQFFNSTIDRNIRFITVTLLEPKNEKYDDCAELTFKAVKEYKEKAEANGFVVNKDVNATYYKANKTFNSAVCAVIMIMFALIAFGMITGIYNIFVTIGALVLSLLAFAGTYVIPDSLVSLYPTAYSVIQPCFAITVILWFVKRIKDNQSVIVSAIAAVALMLLILLTGAVGMGTMLSGTEYYINNSIFRGIKLSLLVPTMYTAIIYYFMFMKTENDGIIDDIKKVLTAEIKVYWLIIAGIIGAIGIYYIVRSGNVNSISSIEQTMRSTLTEIFPARPRTKEFLVGYPCLVLFVYYSKKVDIKLVRWILAVGASILATSITNSFCHVFTDFSTIVSRTFNGLTVGIFVAAFAYIGNAVMIKIIKEIGKRINNTEMR